MSGYQSRLKTFPQRPYYDDFDVNKRFLQILFRPGLAVQARELTQMQTILQEQISRLGSHFFDNGSKIVGGEMSIKNKIEYIKLPNTLPTASYYDYVGSTVTNGTLVGRIVHYIPPVTVDNVTDPATIYVEYESAEGDISSFGFSGVYSVSLDSFGSGYTGNVPVSIAGDGTGATAVCTIVGGKVNTITLATRGIGYTTNPTVTIDNVNIPTPGATAATASAKLISQNMTITVNNTLTELQETFTITVSPDNIGIGAVVFINDGIYFINGRFIVVDKQVLVVSKYGDINNVGTDKEIGFLLKESIVTPEQDGSLYDNAIGSENESAPGATRYKMEAILATKPTDDTVKDFIQIMVLRAGLPTTPPSQTDYTPLFQEMFARRTYDESGDYIVNDFAIDVREHLNTGDNNGKYLAGDGGLSEKVYIELDPGKAYVRGYEIETNSSTPLEIDKSRDFNSVEDVFISNPYDSYFYADLTPGAVISAGNTTTTDKFSFFHQTNAITQLKNASNQTIFTVILSGAQNDSTQTRFYFTQLTPTTTSSRLDDVLYIEQSSKKAKVLTIGGNKFVVKQGTSTLLYPIPLSYVRNITGSVYKVFRELPSIVISTNTVNISPDSTYQYTSDANNYLLSIPSVGYIRPLSVAVQVNGGVVITLQTNIYDGASCDIIVIAAKKTYTPRPKTELNDIDTHVFTNNNDIRNFQLQQTDIYKINSISIDSVDYTASYDLDNGQRDNTYDYGRIKLKAGAFLPSAGTLTVDYQYFSHGAGDFFTIDSYSALTYEQIPKYKNAFLGNYIDVRSSIYASSSVSKVVPFTDIVIDYSYYLSRSDIIVLNSNGEFSVVRGVPSLSPKTPKDIDNSITLYQLFIPAYTFDTKEIDVKKLNYKRFTMRDIANLEKRIENLEYYTLLSLLEADIQGKEFLDKFKSGFIVDNFESLTTGDVENSLHTVAIDFSNKEMRPETITTAVNVEVSTSSNIGRYASGIIMLPADNVEYTSQKLASTLVRLQPFTKFNWNGKITLNPSVDNWFSVTQAPDLTLDAGFFPSNQRASVVNQKIWDIAGRVFTGNEVGSNASGTVSVNAGGVSNANEVAGTGRARIFGGELTTSSVTSQTNYIGTRVVDSGVAPYIRRRLVEFTITGLKPNTIVTPYFDGTNVSKWCFINQPQYHDGDFFKGGSFGDGTGGSNSSFNSYIFYKDAWIREDFFINPPLPSSVRNTDVFKSNGAGVIRGWFLIPNNELARFKTGTKKMVVSDELENPTTTAEGYYAASGTFVKLQNVFVTTRFVTRESFWYDPVAQSFVVDNPEGIFASSVDLYFGPEANTAPEWVTAQIRNMVNGYPGDHTIATVDKYVNTGSFDANTPVRFTFEHPVYLQPNNEYALVVISDSTDLAVWCSELGQKSVRPGDFSTFTGEYINKQPSLGSLFKSQNNKTWTAEQTQDLKFALNRAKFRTDVTGSVTFSNKLNPADTNGEGNIFETGLVNNPFSVAYGVRIELLTGGSGYASAPTVVVNDVGSGGSGFAATALLGTNIGIDDDKVVGFDVTNSGSGYTSAPTITLMGAATTAATISTTYFPGNRIYVRHYNHGFKINDLVTFKFNPTATGTILASYTVGSLTGTHIVRTAGLDYYTIDMSTPNTITVDAGGGTGIKATKVIPYSYARILTDAIVLNGTKLAWNLYGRDYFTNTISSTPVGIVEGKIVDMGGLRVIKANNDNSLQVVGEFSTSSDYISPVIDEQRLTVYTMGNRINDKVDLTSNDSVSRYATKNITLVNPANEIQCYIDLNNVSGTHVKVYCMVATEPVSVSNDIYTWNEMTLVSGGAYTDINEFKEVKWQYNTDIDFTNFVVKVVLANTSAYGDSNYRHVVPRCKRFRAIALKT